MVKSLFRCWSLITLVAVFAFAMWWIHWPIRAASRLIKDRETFLAALKISEPVTYEWFSRDADSTTDIAQSDLYVFPRTWADTVICRQSFGVGSFLFSIERGTIVSGPSFYLRSGDVWYTR
jgi:hypothetical protein